MARNFSLVLTLTILLGFAPSTRAQMTSLNRGSDNITVEGHKPLGPRLSVMDLELEQELSRPYAYVARGTLDGNSGRGTDIIDLSNPKSPKVLLRWRIENQDLHTGLGGMDIKYFKWKNHYYVVQSYQFGQGPDNDLGAVILDVTGLPDPGSVRDVARIHEPDLPGGFHNIFIYKHSDGRVLLLTTVNGGQANIYDLGMAVEGDVENSLVGSIPVPEGASGGPVPFLFYHDLYAAWHPDTQQDRFYGGGTGGYYVFDITDIENPALQFSITGVSGVEWGHTFTPSPDGRFAVGETEYQYAPLRIFDMKPALDGETKNIRRSISAWTANWKNLVHNHEVRWPYVFVSGYQDGLQIFSLQDPKNPRTVGYYDTYIGPANDGVMDGGVGNGAFGVDVRNADGLIVISDISTGIWTFRMEGFEGWNGEDWGMPDISSVQKWDEESKEGTR